MYRYRLSSTKASSEKFGNCEICGKWCSEVFMQVEQQQYNDPDLPGGIGWTEYNCKTHFGHKECLESIRR